MLSTLKTYLGNKPIQGHLKPTESERHVKGKLRRWEKCDVETCRGRALFGKMLKP
jgi:hypothetical protein